MRRCYAIAVTVMLALAGASAKAQDVSRADKDRALQYLESTKKGVLDATKGLSDAQWNFKPAPDRWSVAEVMEHLTAAEDMLRGMTEEQVMKTPAVPVRDAVETKKARRAVVARFRMRMMSPQKVSLRVLDVPPNSGCPMVDGNMSSR